jgi:predicted Zn-dependent protease
VPIEPSEKSLWSSLRVEVKEPDFDRRRSGGVTIRNDTYYEIIANAEIQKYIAELGSRLVPPYQRDLPHEDPAKIPFKFYVVRQDQAGASAVATGVIMVYTRTFEILKSEAQLASMVAHEIAHLTQKHLWRLDKMPASSIKVGFARSYENQADRLALDYMVHAGYDPREAARTWKLMAQKLGFTPLRGSHENYSVRRAFVMGELEANYHQLDYSGLRTEEGRYRQIAERVKKPF